MSNEVGPWGHRDPPPPAAAAPTAPKSRWDRGSVLRWLLFVAGVGGIVLALARAFPEGVQTQEQWSDVAYYAGFLALLAAGAFRVRTSPARFLRHAAGWVAIGAVLALVFAYRDELAGVPQHLKLAFSTARPVVIGDGELVIPEDDHGAFEVIGKVNGQRVRFLIDTGATDTVLSPADARRLGLDTGTMRYEEESETANGKGYGAPFVARRLEVGPIRFDDFKVSVNQAPMSSSLLGLSFLNRLSSFEIRGRKLYLKWRSGAAG
jgi:aspartyl protease family protein